MDKDLVIHALENIQSSLKSLECKIDAQACDITSLKETRAENRGMARVAHIVTVAAAGFVTFIINIIQAKH